MFCDEADQHRDVENLYSEAVCRPEEVLYEGSDDEYYESPQIRQARLAAAARRFLDGDDSFILSSALKGPFEGSAGWANPWRSKRSKPASPAEANAMPSDSKNRGRSQPSQTQNFETQANSSLDCHLPSPESLKQGPLAPHNFMEEDEFARVQNWRTTIPSVGPENDAFWAGDPIKSTSPKTRSRKRKRAQGSDWLKKDTSKRPRAEEESDTHPLRRSRRTRSTPNLSNRPSADATSTTQPSHVSQSTVFKRRSLKAQPEIDAEDELTSSINAPPTNSVRRRSSPIKRVSPHSVLKSTQGSSSYSEDELAHEDEADLKAAATLSSPVSNKGQTRPVEAIHSRESKYITSPRRSKRLSTSPKQGGKRQDHDSISQEGDISPEMETQRDESFCFKKPTNAQEPSSSESTIDSHDDEEHSSSASDDEVVSELPLDTEEPIRDTLQHEIADATEDAIAARDIFASNNSDEEMDDVSEVKHTPTVIDVSMQDMQPSSQDDEDSMDSSSSSSEGSDTSEAESEVGALSTISDSQMRELSAEVRKDTTATAELHPEPSKIHSITMLSADPSEDIPNVSEESGGFPSSMKEVIEEEESLSTENSDSDEAVQSDSSGEDTDQTPVSHLGDPCIQETTSTIVPASSPAEKTMSTEDSKEEIDASDPSTPDEQAKSNTPQSPWSKSQYSQFLSTAVSQSPMGDLEKADPEPPVDCQSPWVASQGPLHNLPGLSEPNSDADIMPPTVALGPRGVRQSTPECQIPFQPFSAFMTPSPERIARRKARPGSRFSSGCIPSSQALASAMKNPWSSGKAGRRVSWAPLPHETTTEPDSASSEHGEISPSQRHRPSSPPPQVSIADVPQEVGEDRFRDHFDAVARRATEHPQRILPTESQQTVGSPDAYAMAENFIAFDENKTVDSGSSQQKQGAGIPRSENIFSTEADNDDLLEDVFNDIQELLQPWNLDVELEQARKESGNDPISVDIWAS